MLSTGHGEPDWDRFAAEIACIAEVAPTDVSPETRIVEDLGYDSLALAELALVLIDDSEMDDVADSLVDKTWTGVTVGELYEQYRSRAGTGSGRGSELRSEA